MVYMFANGINFLFAKGRGLSLPVILMACLLAPAQPAAAQMQGAVTVTSPI